MFGGAEEERRLLVRQSLFQVGLLHAKCLQLLLHSGIDGCTTGSGLLQTRLHFVQLFRQRLHLLLQLGVLFLQCLDLLVVPSETLLRSGIVLPALPNESMVPFLQSLEL